MDNRETSPKKSNIASLILTLIILVLIFFVYKKVVSPKLNEILKSNESISSDEGKLYPPFSIKIKDILDNSTFAKLKIFGYPVKEAGLIGNSNPFFPFTPLENPAL